MSGAELKFLPEHFARADEDDDAAFYGPPRMVHHLDEPARAALTAFYAEILPANARVLDLMSSWVSHLPEVSYEQVTGLGMNAAELDANPVLTARHVQNLNADSILPFDDASFDACLIALSVQYLTRPLEVFAEIARVLAPGGSARLASPIAAFRPKRWRCGARSMIPDISGWLPLISVRQTSSRIRSMPISRLIPGGAIRCLWCTRARANCR